LTPGVSLFFGKNAQGKTNLLEACYYLSTLSSPRAERILDLARWGTTRFALGGRIDEADETTYIKIETLVSPTLRRRVLIDDRPGKRLELLAHFPCVYFSPDDLYMVKRGSGLRRKFLDSLLARIDPAYGKHLAKYEDTVARRNVVLKKAFMSVAWDKTLQGLDEILISAGATVLNCRLALMSTFSRQVAETYSFIAGDQCIVRYSSSMGDLPGSPEEMAPFFRERLSQMKVQERDRGVTLIGPHRDDIAITFGDKTVRYFGSQGEQRSVALALRMAEALALEETFGRKPALLLDDVFSELDESRRQKVLSLCDFGHQILLTSTDPMTIARDKVNMYAVNEDSVKPV
jgi:DNA replication and repair protein RecF